MYGRVLICQVEQNKVRKGREMRLMIAFDPQKKPLNVPFVQVSLYDNEDADKHYRRGKALESLRGEGILMIGAGMAIHNLRDYRATQRTGKTMLYATSFDAALNDAATTANSDDHQPKMSALMRRADARQVHPTVEHILPIHVAAGAAGSLDRGERLWTMVEGPLSWAQYRFGDVVAA